MYINFLSRLAAVALLLAICAVAASAQVASASGKVTLKQADGTTVPVQGAAVVFYRTDIKGQYKTKTDKSGRYVYAGLPLTGTYIIAVSAPNARPTFLTGVRISQQPENDFALDPGDGSELTLDQIKAAGGGGGGARSGGGGAPPKESAETKAAREKMAKEMAEVEAKNRKITETNEIIGRTFKAGNEALNAKRYDEAIQHYKEGVAADPEQPALFANMSVALRARGVDRYNAAIKATDQNAKTSGLEAAKQDWREAAEAAGKAVALLNKPQEGAGAGADANAQAQQNQNKLAALSARAEAMRFVASKGDPSQADAALAAYQEYIAAETDPAKKSKAQLDAANMLLDAGAADKAIAEFQKILTAEPDNPKASLGIGLALFQSGDKAKFQDAANYLQRYVDKAPDTDPLKQSAKEALDYLKTAEKVQPQKVQPTRPASGGRRRG